MIVSRVLHAVRVCHHILRPLPLWWHPANQSVFCSGVTICALAHTCAVLEKEYVTECKRLVQNKLVSALFSKMMSEMKSEKMFLQADLKGSSPKCRDRFSSTSRWCWCCVFLCKTGFKLKNLWRPSPHSHQHPRLLSQHFPCPSRHTPFSAPLSYHPSFLQPKYFLLSSPLLFLTTSSSLSFSFLPLLAIPVLHPLFSALICQWKSFAALMITGQHWSQKASVIHSLLSLPSLSPSLSRSLPPSSFFHPLLPHTPRLSLAHSSYHRCTSACV